MTLRTSRRTLLRGAGVALALPWLGGEGSVTGRVYGELRQGIGGRRGATIRVKAGLATRPTLRQAAFRLGGVGTVRGHQYGERRGQAVWAARQATAVFRRNRTDRILDGDGLRCALRIGPAHGHSDRLEFVFIGVVGRQRAGVRRDRLESAVVGIRIAIGIGVVCVPLDGRSHRIADAAQAPGGVCKRAGAIGHCLVFGKTREAAQLFDAVLGKRKRDRARLRFAGIAHQGSLQVRQGEQSE